LLKSPKINQDQHKLTLTFKDKSLEQLFRIDHAHQTLPQIRLALIIAAILYALFAIIDFLVVPEGQWVTLIIRFVLAIPTFFLGYLATFRPYFRKRLQLVVFIVILIAGLGIALIALMYENARSDLHLTGTLLPIFWAFIYSGLRFMNAVKVSLALLVLYNLLFISMSELPQVTLVVYNFFLVGSLVIGVLGGYTIECYFRRDFVNKKLLKREKQANEKLLLNILPAHIATELKEKPGTIAKDFDQITVLFTDLVGFSKLSKSLSANEVVQMLNEIFCQFDELTNKLELEKIKTIGDAYMVTSNLRNPNVDSVFKVAEFALGINEIIENYNQKTGTDIKLRTGIHTGDAVAGVIGVKKFVYDVWGNTVNVASRMESECPEGRIQASAESYQILREKFEFESRGKIKVKGFHDMDAFLLLRQKEVIENACY